MTVLHVLQFVQVPSFALYLLFLVVLVRYREQLKSRFFHICISLGVADIVFIISVTVYRFIIIYSVGDLWPPTVRKIYRYIVLCTVNGSTIAQLGGVFIMAVNRLSAVMAPARYKRLWDPTKALLFALGFQWFLPLCYTLIQVFHPEFQLHATNGTNYLGYVMKAETYVTLFQTFFVYTALYGVVTLLLYGVMLTKLIFTRTSHSSNRIEPEAKTNAEVLQERKAKRREMKLVLVGLVLALPITYTAMEIKIKSMSYQTDTSEWFKEAVKVFQPISDEYVQPVVDFVFTFSNPYLVLAMSSSARKCFIAYVSAKVVWICKLFSRH